MPLVQLVLLGVPAFVGEITGATKCKFWHTEADFDRGRLIEIDLSLTPDLDPTDWENRVEVDSSSNEGLTTIGPTFHKDSHKGAVYLASRLVTKYRNSGVLNDWPDPGDHDYQYQVAVRFETGTTERYYGFKAQVLGQRQGLTLLGFIGAGEATPSRTMWLDLADPSIVDPTTNMLTKLKPTTALNTIDAVFLPRASAQNLLLEIPKLPPGFGVQEIQPLISLDPNSRIRPTQPVPSANRPAGDLQARAASARPLRASSPVGAQATAQIGNKPASRISIVSNGGDRELGLIRAKEFPFDSAGSEGDVVQALARHARNGVKTKILDLIGHSADHCFLHIGDWIVDAAAAPTFTTDLKPLLQQIGVTGVRLLGCSTAVTKPGWTAMQQIAAGLGIQVFGTTRFLSVTDFGPDGFTSTNAIAKADQSPIPPRINDLQVSHAVTNSRIEEPGRYATEITNAARGAINRAEPAANERVSGLSVDDARKIPFHSLDLVPLPPDSKAVGRPQVPPRSLQELQALIDPDHAWQVPGLLAQPLGELLLPSDSGYLHKVEFLIEYELVRVFPRSSDYPDGLIYRVKEPSRLGLRGPRSRTENPARSM